MTSTERPTRYSSSPISSVVRSAPLTWSGRHEVIRLPGARGSPVTVSAPDRDEIAGVFRILFYRPEIPGNTGNAIRLCANTGCELHLVEPLGFNFDSAHLRRAGLDYHDLADVRVHRDLTEAWRALSPANVYAFSTHASRWHTDVSYTAGDVLFFGPESVGLPAEVQESPEVTDRVRLPMLPTSRSLNLSNSSAVAVYEAWRQQDFTGAT